MKSTYSDSRSIRSCGSHGVRSGVEKLLVTIEKVKTAGEGKGKKGFRYYDGHNCT